MFQLYFKAIQEKYLSDSESSEHTFRTALENLLNSFVDSINRKLIIKHEPTNQESKGRPDFKVTTPERLTIGLIETKKIGEDLKKILHSEQMKRYKELSDNIILTDYLQFYLIKKGEIVVDTILFSDYNLRNKKFKIENTRIIELIQIFKTFFESEPETIYKTHDLAFKLSEKAKFLRENCYNELETNTDDSNLLNGIFEAFKSSLLPLLDTKYFSDIYAQTLTYGLFLSALNCIDPKKELTAVSAYSSLPNSFPLIRELFHRIDDFPVEITWAIDEIITILKVTDFSAIKKEFAEYRQKEKGFNDPFIFFYEDFLKHYDKSQRELRGVYYTPEPVVSFIVRSVDEVLRDTFGMNDSLTNKDVTLLDFATGTGAFLLQSFQLAIEQAKKIGDKAVVNKIINEQLIDKFYGFELLVAPYVIANLKISEYFKEQGYSLEPNKRLNIFLTNSLTQQEPQNIPTMPQLSKEGREANKIKNKEILVILGNPPYSVSSMNSSESKVKIQKGSKYSQTYYLTKDVRKDKYLININYKTANTNINKVQKNFIGTLLELYKYNDVERLQEKNLQPLSDDYIKFIRFAHWKMEDIERGIIGIITNNSYIDGMIHRGMRQKLLHDFDFIYILNLHGNSRLVEKAPDGTKDENVFDIKQGVCIAFFVKKDNKSNKNCKVFYHDLYGMRKSKYSFLSENSLKTIKWQELIPQSDNYYFAIKDFSEVKYLDFFSLKSIFNLSNIGIASGKDEVFVNYKLSDFKNDEKKNVIDYFYRPFDIRKINYDLKKLQRARFTIMKNIHDNNFVLCVGRFAKNKYPQILITQNIVCRHSITDMTYIFPLYILSNGEDRMFFGVKEQEVVYNAGNKTKSGLTKTPNFTKEFDNFIFEKYSSIYSPEQILGYIYAVLHSPTYRIKYFEFLKIDFPKIPFTDSEVIFEKLSEIGRELIDIHLMKIDYKGSYIAKCEKEGEGNNFAVEQVVFDQGKVRINKERYFAPVSEEIWNFHIGGYQVLDKWLKERKKHNIILESTDIEHFLNMICIIDNTIKIMEQIDIYTKEWI